MDDAFTLFLDLPAQWVSFRRLEQVLLASGDPYGAQRIHLRVPSGCSIMVDAGA